MLWILIRSLIFYEYQHSGLMLIYIHIHFPSKNSLCPCCKMIYSFTQQLVSCVPSLVTQRDTFGAFYLSHQKAWKWETNCFSTTSHKIMPHVISHHWFLYSLFSKDRVQSTQNWFYNYVSISMHLAISTIIRFWYSTMSLFCCIYGLGHRNIFNERCPRSYNPQLKTFFMLKLSSNQHWGWNMCFLCNEVLHIVLL